MKGEMDAVRCTTQQQPEVISVALGQRITSPCCPISANHTRQLPHSSLPIPVNLTSSSHHLASCSSYAPHPTQRTALTLSLTLSLTNSSNMSGADAVDMEQQAETEQRQRTTNKHSPPPSNTDNEPSKRQKTDGYSSSHPATSDPSLQPSTSPTSASTSPPLPSSIFTPHLPAPLYVVNTNDRGRCVYSTLTLPANTVLLRDAPIALIQFQKNQRRVLACSHCGCFIGSLTQQLDTLAATEGDVDTVTQEPPAQLPAISAADQTLSPIVHCQSGCTALYCSDHCQQSHYAAYHQLLCPGPLQQRHPRLSYSEKKARKVARRAEVRAGIKKQPTPPLVAFHRHAMRHHQFFLLAAQIVARLTLMERRGDDIENELRALSEYAQKEWIATIDLDEGYDDEERQKGTVGESETNHEEHNINAASKEQQDGDDEQDDGYSPDDEGGQHDHEDDRRLAHRHLLLSHLSHVLTKSYHLLASALFTSVALPTPHWYSVSFYSHLLGLLRMNNVAVELRSPLVEYVGGVDGLQGGESWSEVASVVGERTRRVMEERRREEEWERRNAAEEQEDDEDDDEGGGEEAGDSDSEQSSEEEWSDSEDDESFRKEDEDSYEPMQFNWPVPQPTAPTVVVLPAPISQPLLSTAPLADLPAQQPIAIVTPPSSAAATTSSVHSFSSTLFPSYHGSALYSSIACLNHSCSPNVVVHFERDARPLVLSVGDGVKAGEECLMTYCDVEGVSRAERWKELDGYGFVCSCERCARESEKEAESEKAVVGNEQSTEAGDGERPK